MFTAFVIGFLFFIGIDLAFAGQWKDAAYCLLSAIMFAYLGKDTIKKVFGKENEK